jgi:hypothetical protein
VNQLAEIRSTCPYCGEPVDLLVDGSVPEQRYVEDCPVCCRPMVVWARIGPEGACSVALRREEDC